MKKIISLILVAALCLSFALNTYAESPEASLYENIYGDGMLFEQNKQAVFAGFAKAGTSITAELYSADGVLCAEGSSVADSDGKFEVSFLSPSGGYEEYTVILKADSYEFSRLKNVVFGELWLSSGQSNMQYPLAQSRTGREMFANQEKLSKWLRVLLVPSYPGNTVGPEFTYAEPQTDIDGAVWVTGENLSVYNMSAVSYFFAKELMEELDMPVGIRNASLGGSAIASWLSRDAIDGDAAVRNNLISDDDYIELSDWEADKQNIYVDMTANYNHKIEALGNFRPSGMIWYQGETDVGKSAEFYAGAFKLMQRSYSEHFGYENELMPIIYTQLASFLYGENTFVIPDRNLDFTEIQQALPESRAMVTIYDVPLTYIPEAGAIHPECKEEIGERMAFAAEGLVYGEKISYSAATVKETVISDGAVFVTFENAGDGLVCPDGELFGFAVCGENGVYVQAQAEIISPDTVKIYSESVAAPRSASYAYSVSNIRSNLYASADGKPSLPVSLFITDPSIGTHYWTDKQWIDCDNKQIWHLALDGDEHIGFYDAWTADGADVSFSDGAVNIKSSSNSFAAAPVMRYTDTQLFHDIDTDYSDYGKMSFYLRNNGESDITLSKVKFTVNSLRWYAPEVEGTKDVEAVIPADGEWHLVSVDLNSLYLYGNEGGVSRPCGRLNKVSDIRFEFSGTGESDISIDQIRFAPSEGKNGIRFNTDISKADTFLEKITALFVSIIGAVISVFG
jgi:sialate O-acetylesterase